MTVMWCIFLIEYDGNVCILHIEYDGNVVYLYIEYEVKWRIYI